MGVDFLTQPERQIGLLLIDLLNSETPPRRVNLVSAFANRQTLLRLREPIRRTLNSGGHVSVVVGIDLDGTSEESLREILSWGVDSRIVKNRRSRSTFHPKVYLVELADQAQVFVGSSNLTDGGLFTNYEAAMRATYDLPI